MQQEEDAAAILLSDQLMMDDDDDDDIFIMNDVEYQEDDEENSNQSPSAYAYESTDDIHASFDNDIDEEDGLVEEIPFEPVYPATAGLLFSESSEDKDENENDNDSNYSSSKGIVLEAVNLDNILPVGSRRRRN